MALNDLVTINISRQTTAVSQAGFGTPAVVGPHVVFSDRYRLYSDAASLITDGFETTDPIYQAVLAAFSQELSPTQVLVGRRQVDNIVVSVDTVIDSTVYTVTINGTDFTFNSGVSATAASIALGLVGAINGGAEPVTAVDNVDGTFDLDADVAGTAFTVAVDSNMSIAQPVASDTVTNDLTAINDANSDWYALVLTSRVQADVEEAQTWIEAQDKIFFTVSSDTDILDSGSTTDIAATTQSNNYDRSLVIYNADPTDFADAAWLGAILPNDPGSVNWAYKTLTGIVADSLTPTQRTAALGKNANLYENTNSVSITEFGTVGSGEYIDVIRFIDWFKARLQERIFTQQVNLKKIPGTDAGIGLVEQEIRAQIQDGIDAGGIDPIAGFTVTVPKNADRSTADKAARRLTGVEFQFALAGAINTVTINGIVTL